MFQGTATGENLSKRPKRLMKEDMLTSDDLAVLFNPAQFQAAADQPFKFWVPLIALYTGARQNEIAKS